MGITGISPINNNYNVATKAQYETYPNANTATYATNYPAYEEEEPKKSNLGLIALGVLGIAGIGIGIAKHKKVADLEKVVNETKTKLDDVTKKLTETEAKVAAAESKATTAESALAKANETIENLKNPPKKKFFLTRIIDSLNKWRKNIVF